MPPRTSGRKPPPWTPARRLLQEWRGFDPCQRPDRDVSVKEVLSTLLPSLGLDSRLNEADIRAAWRDIVGDFVAEHSQPDRLLGGILHIRVVQPTVRYELDRTLKPEILRKLRGRFGTIRDIKFVL